MLMWWIIHILDKLYYPRGYLRAAAGRPIIQLLPEKNGPYPVRIILPISSGPLFTFQSVKFDGLAKVHSTSLLAKWKLKPGATYDTNYVENFIFDEILSAPWAQHSGTEIDDANPCAKLDDAARKVFLTITVEPPKKTYMYHPGKVDYWCSGDFKILKLSPLP
jgi:outer membrane protein assembly factor BamA